MEWWIKHLVEPERLVLEWRPPENVPERTRWAVGELRRTLAGAEFRYLAGSELEKANRERSIEKLRAAGFLGYPAFLWDTPNAETVYREGALEAFVRRLPSPKRSDFAQYLEHFHLQPRPNLSGFALLAATGASLPNDGFSLVDPLDGEVRLQDVVLEVNGFRHYASRLTRQLVPGSKVELIREPTSEYDPWAVRIEINKELSGYISRLQSYAVSRWLTRDAARAWLVRVNGPAFQPRATILVEVRERALSPAA